MTAHQRKAEALGSAGFKTRVTSHNVVIESNNLCSLYLQQSMYLY